MKNCPNCGAPIKIFQRECAYCGTELEPEGAYIGRVFEEDPFDGNWIIKFQVPAEYVIDSAGYIRDCTVEDAFSKMLKDRAAHKIANQLKPYIQIHIRDFDPVRGGVEVVAKVKGIKQRLEEMHFEENSYSF